MLRAIVVVIYTCAAFSLVSGHAHAEPTVPCPPESDLNIAVSDCYRSGEEVAGYLARSGTDGYQYRVRIKCKDNVYVPVCDNPRPCVTANGEAGIWYGLQRLDIEEPPPAVAWEYFGEVCLRPRERDPFDLITPDKVWQRMKLLDWPAAELVVQPPGGRTLVNFRTNVYTTLEATPQTRTVRMFHVPVEIEATPVGYTWHWGDGTDAETTDWAGAPVPENVTSDDLDDLITHEYADAEVTVTPSVDVTYQGRYRIDGGDWVPIEQTLTLPGPAVDLEVIEARVHLVG